LPIIISHSPSSSNTEGESKNRRARTGGSYD
jgi:hypothetical protein